MADSQAPSGFVAKLKKMGVYTFWFLFLFGLAGSTVGILRMTTGEPPRPDLELDALIGENPGRLSITVASSRGRYGDYDLLYGKTWGVEGEPTFVMEGLDDMFTSMAVAILVDKGHVDEKQPVATYLTHLKPEVGNIPVEALLTHTSGLPAGVSDLSEATPVYSGKSSFSPLNYNILRELVKSVSKLPYHQFVQGHILAPLEVSTRWDDERGDWLTTSGDLSIFEHRLNSNLLIGLDTHLRLFSAKKLGDGVRGDYAWGWRVKALHGLRLELFATDSERFNGVVMRLPEKNFSAVLLYDGPSSSFDCMAVAERLSEIYLGREMPFYRPQRSHTASASH